MAQKTVDDLGLTPTGTAIIKGAQGATGTQTIASFTAGFVLIMVALVIVLNFVNSRSGRAVMAIRDNRIAAESVGINITKYKMIAFTISAAIAGAAGALYGLNYSNITSAKFDFNTSILILVFVVLGGLRQYPRLYHFGYGALCSPRGAARVCGLSYARICNRPHTRNDSNKFFEGPHTAYAAPSS